MPVPFFVSSLSHGCLLILLLSLCHQALFLGLSPSSFSLHWGTGSMREEGASHGTGVKQGRDGEFGQWGEMTKCHVRRKAWEWMCPSVNRAFLPCHHWRVWIAFSNKNIDRTQMFRMFQKKKNQSWWSCPSVFSITYKCCFEKCLSGVERGKRAVSQQRTQTHLFMMKP